MKSEEQWRTWVLMASGDNASWASPSVEFSTNILPGRDDFPGKNQVNGQGECLSVW